MYAQCFSTENKDGTLAARFANKLGVILDGSSASRLPLRAKNKITSTKREPKAFVAATGLLSAAMGPAPHDFYRNAITMDGRVDEEADWLMFEASS